MLGLSPSILSKLDRTDLRELRYQLVRAIERVDWELHRIEHNSAEYMERLAATMRPAPQSIRWGKRVLRNVQVMRLARQGFTNAAIGARLALHPSTVSRIVQHELRAAREPPAAETMREADALAITAAAAAPAAASTSGRARAGSRRARTARAREPSSPATAEAAVLVARR